MVATYKFTYFDSRGRGEIARLMFAAAGIKYEDVRVPKPEWGALKPHTPWGSVPVLEVDGKPLAQTQAIVRYIAGEHGLAGSGNWEQALVNSAVGAAADIWDGMAKINFGDPALKDTMTAKYKESFPASLQFFEKFIQEHGKDGHVVGSKMTTADIALFNTLDQVQSDKGLGLQGVSDQYAGIKKVLETVHADAKIAAYLKSRK